MNNDARLNNLIYRTNNIVPYTPKILKADEYIKSKLFIITNGINIYGDSKNVSIFADETVLPGTTGPILHFYGNVFLSLEIVNNECHSMGIAFSPKTVIDVSGNKLILCVYVYVYVYDWIKHKKLSLDQTCG